MNPVERMATSRWFQKVGPKVIPPLDRIVHKVTGGRMLLSSLYSPMCMLTTTGRKTGLERTVPIACFPDGEDLIVVGSNFARDDHPAWSNNLIASPEATVEYRGRRWPVVAHLGDETTRPALWAKVLQRMPHFAVYDERTARDIRVFRLEPTTPEGGAGRRR